MQSNVCHKLFTCRTTSLAYTLFEHVTYSQKRTFYRMLNAVFNRPDRERIRELGPDRACAEWLLRCGAHVRWKGRDHWLTDYNALPPTAGPLKPVIEEVNADQAAVMDIGFEHFDGCRHIRRVRFYYCPYLEDGALGRMGGLTDVLQELEIGSCGDITERGLESLCQLQALRSLVLYDLPAVRNKAAIHKKLTKNLPNCDVKYRDLQSDGQNT